ncbi:MAG: branched-chain amino acid aminotransferase [Desulfobacteraceae bacterium]|jgi:branched-chain amino acid aminotransferase|nr:MAG: branched-chain amino acid aminotransferase [Desulfobacteraceae bacterium]
MSIEVKRHPHPPAPPTGDYGFGQVFTPHMFKLDYREGQWRNPRIEPYGPLSLDPAAKVLHYGQEIFEGMKAYRNPKDGSVHMFRPDKNVARFNISCGRMCMPEVDPDLFMEALNLLIDIDRDWVPEPPEALYIRPTMIATQTGLGVKASTDYLFYIIIGPVGSYFARGISPLRLKVEERYVRSAPGGTGYAKTGGNYAAALLPIKQAQTEGFDQIIWLDAREKKFVEEMGAMNIAFVYEDRIITAPTGDTILDGVTRDSVGILCRDFGYNWIEEHPAVAKVCADADTGLLKEVLACGTAAVVTPVGVMHYGGKDHQVGDGKEGAVTRRLREALCEIHGGNSKLHPEWIFKVPVHAKV